MNTPGTDDQGVQKMRARCERCRSLLGELARIHLSVDAPSRVMRMDEPDWICRLRKICLHVLAIDSWEISAGVEHVIATELRAAYEQMGVVWKNVPGKCKLVEIDGGCWAKEAKNGILAIYDHPTPQSLILPTDRGGFTTSKNGMSYAQLAVWLGRLGLGYGAAIVYLAQVLGTGEDVESRVATALRGTLE